MADTNYTSYGLLAGNEVTAASGTTTVLGDLGSNLAVAGSGTIIVSDQTNIGSSISDALSNAQNDYSSFITFSPDTTIATSEVGNSTLTPGITEFSYNGTVTIGSTTGTNVLTLNGNGVYIILVPNGDLTTDTSNGQVTINLINNAKASDVYWIISGSLTLGSSGSYATTWNGTVLCQGNITVGNNSTATGSLCAFSNTSNISVNNNKIISTDVQRPKDVSSSDYVNVESTLPDSQAVTISASNTNGGIYMHAGLGGVDVNTTSAISLDSAAASNFTTSNGNLTLEATAGTNNINGGTGINIGTTSTTPVINIGNQTGTETINVYSGTGGVLIDALTGGSILIGTQTSANISIGTNTLARTIITGNNSSSTRQFTRFGTGGWITAQIAETALLDGNTTVTIAQLLTRILTMAPTASRTITLDTATDIVNGISGVIVNDSFDFSVINLSSTLTITVAPGSGGTLVGNGVIAASASGAFRLRITSLRVGSPLYTVYRIS